MHPESAFRRPKSANGHQHAEVLTAFDVAGRRFIAHLMPEFGEQ